MAGPFKMKGFSGFGNSPMRQDKKMTKTVKGIARKVEQGDKAKAKLVKSETRKLTDREIRIANAKEFNAYAVEKGMKPPQPGDNATDEEVMNYTNFYKNKDNVNMLNKEQKKYFKNKKK
tara:strand:+ start:309 stop:665 length:357 start_codon:yes stop_codon:yes gene_type:complete